MHESSGVRISLGPARGGSLIGVGVGAQVRADHVLQLVLGAAAVQGVIGKQRGKAAPAEDAVGDQHRLLLALVHVPQDILRAGDDDARARVRLHATCDLSHQPCWRDSAE